MRKPRIGRTLCWELQATQCRVKCIMQPDAANNADCIELLVLHGFDQIKRETFQAPVAARSRADELRQRLLGKGWRDVTR